MSLISPKLRSYFKKGLLFGQVVCSHPYVWNESLNQPQLCESKRRYYTWCLNVLVTTVYSLFVIIRCVQVNTDQSGIYSPVRKIYMQCIVFYYAFPVLFQIGILLRMSDILLFFQQNVTLMDQLEVIFLRQSNRNGCLSPKVFDLFFDFVWYNFIYLASLIGILATLQPNSPEFISSVILPEKGTERSVLLALCVVFQIYYINLYIANGFLFVYLSFGFLFPGVVVLREIKNSMNGETADAKVKFKMYKEFEILRKSYHYVYCTFFLPGVKSILIGITIFCCYGAVRMHGLIVVFLAILGLVCFVVLVTMLMSFAQYDKYSYEILFLMKSPKFQNTLDPVQKKTQASLNPIRIRMGSSYHVDMPCVITVLKIVLDATINFLLANL